MVEKSLRIGEGAANTYLNQDTSAIDTVKDSGGTILGIVVMSTAAAPVYLNLYNSTSATLPATVPTNQFIVPTQGDANGSGFVVPIPPVGINYPDGIQVAAATTFDGAADPGDNLVITNIFYV